MFKRIDDKTREMTMNKSLIIGALISVALLAGCASNKEPTIAIQGTSTVTKGVELQDLQRALNEGAINQDEYDTLKKKILKRSQ